MLITDDAGARLLIDHLGLNFSTYSTTLNKLDERDSSWWALGKLYAYCLQRDPFVHIDTDVFLWEPLPKELETAPLFAQNPECLKDFGYNPWKFRRLHDCGGWAPPEAVEFSTEQNDMDVALCCGIFGGNRTDFISYYADLAIRIIEHPDNRTLWQSLGTEITLLEQLLPVACLQYHRNKPESIFHDIVPRFLFDSMGSAFDERKSKACGYTHLLGSAKSNPVLMEYLKIRVETDYPELYERCMRYVHDHIYNGKGRTRCQLREPIMTF
jgi:hypothetical protein